MFFGPGRIELVDVPRPAAGPGEVLVRIGAALTCATDFKAYRQGHPVLLGELPAPFGHELAGTVEEIGEGTAGFATGMRVVAANSAPCDRCPYCKKGQSQLCDELKLHNGAYAEYSLVPAQIVKHNLYPIPSRLTFQEAALAEPLACALHAVDAMRVEAGERAAIVGAGTMALLLIQALKARGARVLVVGRNPGRLARAEAAGADRTLSAEDGTWAAQAREWAGGIGPDVAFEAVGKAETWQQAAGLVRKGGRVCLAGGCATGTSVALDAHRVHYEQIEIHGVFHHTPKYFGQAVDLLSLGRVRTSLLVASSIQLDEVPAYFERMRDESSPKVAVIP